MRKILAEKAKVPAFVIFGDKTLIEFATLYPKSQEEMMRINGVGPVKWSKYGAIFLSLIQKHVHTPQ